MRLSCVRIDTVGMDISEEGIVTAVA
eukprot:COSAG06_NODE_22382_length_725_cov_1.083067_1_plen_25_part_10